MLWTWLIPFLDVEGRYYAAPDLIKANIVPRVKTFNEKNIQAFLEDMNRVGLITLYEVDDEQYLQFRKFNEFQSLRKDKEGKPLPGPSENSQITPVPLPDNSGITPDKEKLSKEKRSKEKVSAKTPLPPDFGISESVRKWAKKKNHSHLDEHLESFEAKCKANGYKYIDWDAAFMEAIRSNWAKIKDGGGNGNGEPRQQSPYKVCNRCGSEYLETDVVDYHGMIICPKCPEAKEMAKESAKRIAGLTAGIGGRASP